MSSGRRLRRDLRGLRSGGAVVLNIVSLIDVFAILVFYLLVNALNAETVPVPPALKLPDSQARAVPKPSVAISISEQEIRLDGRLVGRVDDAETLRRLRAALQASAAAADAEADTAVMNRYLEAYIREAPEQYYWVHKRFKTRPGNERSFYADL